MAAHPRRKGTPLPGSHPIDFDVGDYVLTATVDAKRRNKVSPVWRGPARVTERVNELVFKVEDIGNGVVQELHAQHFKRYADKDLVVSAQLRELAAHGGRGFVVDSIMGHVLKDGVWMVHVLWDLSWNDTSWEPLLRMYEDVPLKVTGYIRLIKDSAARKRLQDALGLSSTPRPQARAKRSRKK